MTSTFCTGCGVALVSGDFFCRECGTPTGVPLAGPQDETVLRPTPDPRAPAAAPAWLSQPVPNQPVQYQANPYLPEPVPAAESPPRRRLGTALVGAAVLALLVALGGGVAAYLLTRGSDSTNSQNADAQQDRTRKDPDAITTALEPTPTITSSSPSGGAGTEGGSPLATLRGIAAADRSAAEDLVGSWVPQLASSGRGDAPGAVLSRFRALKGIYPDAVLVWSGDWPSSFGAGGRSWVVFNAAAADPNSRPVLRWCSAQSNVLPSCWAKRLSYAGTYLDNTDTAPADPSKNRN